MNLLKSFAVVFTLAAAVTGVGFMSSTASATTQNCVNTIDRSKITGKISSTTPFEATVEYKGAALCDGVKQTISFNSYATEGPTWATSGKQTPVDHKEVVLSKSTTKATLKVKSTPCYYQTDLYFGSKKYDGVDGPLPHYPTAVIHPDDNMIDFRNGGNPCKPNPEKTEKSEDRKSCEKGVEKRTITTTVDYKLENGKWVGPLRDFIKPDGTNVCTTEVVPPTTTPPVTPAPQPQPVSSTPVAPVIPNTGAGDVLMGTTGLSTSVGLAYNLIRRRKLVR